MFVIYTLASLGVVFIVKLKCVGAFVLKLYFDGFSATDKSAVPFGSVKKKSPLIWL